MSNMGLSRESTNPVCQAAQFVCAGTVAGEYTGLRECFLDKTRLFVSFCSLRVDDAVGVAGAGDVSERPISMALSECEQSGSVAAALVDAYGEQFTRLTVDACVADFRARVLRGELSVESVASLFRVPVSAVRRELLGE